MQDTFYIKKIFIIYSHTKKFNKANTKILHLMGEHGFQR